MDRPTNLGELADTAHPRVGLARLHRGLWLLPLGLSLVFMLAIGLWAAANEARDRQALLGQLQADATSVQVQMDARLDLERARLRDVALRLSTLRDPASVNLQGMPEVIAGFDRLWNRLVWLDADLRVLALAARTAGTATAPTTDALRVQGRGQADHLQQPVPAAAGFREGQVLARYDLTDLLGSTDLAWLSGRYQVTFVSELGEVMATTARADRTPQGAPIERSLVSFRDATLRLAPYDAPQPWFRGGGTIALLTGLLGLGIAASLLLRREMRQVQHAETVSRTEVAWRRSMEDSALVGLRARDTEGRILYVNKTLCDMVGYGREELVGLLPPLPFWPPEAVDALMASNLNTLAGAAPSTGYETRWRHRDGRPIEVVIFESRLVDGEGRHIGWMGSIVDIGERKRLEDLERRHTEALAQHARLNDLGLIASELAHELNQPLAALVGYSTGLKLALRKGASVDDEVLTAVEALHRNANSAGDILNWIRRQGARAPTVRQPCDLNALVDEVLQPRRRLMQRLSATVRIERAEALPLVLADHIGIEQVLANLLRNAADAVAGRPGPPVIDICTRLIAPDADERASVQVMVCDPGPGLQGRTLDELCTAFFSTKRDGMGLGLGICRSIVEQHGGRFAAADRPGGGACFTFDLPVAVPVPELEPA
jgi:two-component system sensor histidine kinase DctS